MSPDRRFQSTAEYYVRYRPRYPQPFLDTVADALGLDGRGRLLDLGCGPGFLAIGFASRFEEVVGMDPEPEMRAAAREAARAAEVRVTLVPGSSEDLGSHLGSFRMVTMGRSFHWMDRDRTLVTLDALVAPAGAIALFDVDHPASPENGWYRPWKTVRDRHTPAFRRHHGTEGEGHEAVLARSAFPVVRRLAHAWRQRVSIDDLVGRTLSMSSTAPAALGRGRALLETEVRETLKPFAVDGLVEEMLEAEALIARRPLSGGAGRGEAE